MEGKNLTILEVVEEIMAKVKKEYEDLNKLNVMVLGKTGVGKSTLINKVFGEEIVKTGIGRPVTTDIKKYEKQGYPLAIYDTPGLELGGGNAVDSLLDQVVSEIKKSIDSGDISSAIHCVWYCVATTSHRFEESEARFLRELLSKTGDYNVPVILVLTQSFSKKDAAALKAEIEKEQLSVVDIIPVLADDYLIDDDYKVAAYGLDVLTEVMSNVIPEAVQKTFIALQKANLKLKQKKAQAVVAGSATAAAAIGASPIPFSDAFLLIPEQIAMFAGITAVFGLPVDKATMMAVISSTIGTTGATALGKTIVSNLIKLIPYGGKVVGGVISAATAAALTSALGEAYIMVLSMVVKGDLDLKDLDTDKGKEIIKTVFANRLKLKRDASGKTVDDEDQIDGLEV